MLRDKPVAIDVPHGGAYTRGMTEQEAQSLTEALIAESEDGTIAALFEEL